MASAEYQLLDDAGNQMYLEDKLGKLNDILPSWTAAEAFRAWRSKAMLRSDGELLPRVVYYLSFSFWLVVCESKVEPRMGRRIFCGYG